jgi:hypothetical protein
MQHPGHIHVLASAMGCSAGIVRHSDVFHAPVWTCVASLSSHGSTSVWSEQQTFCSLLWPEVPLQKLGAWQHAAAQVPRQLLTYLLQLCFRYFASAYPTGVALFIAQCLQCTAAWVELDCTAVAVSASAVRMQSTPSRVS